MAQIIGEGLRLFRKSLGVLFLKIGQIISGPAIKWYEYWVTHRSSILFLALINTSITTVSELGSRTLVSVVSGSMNDGFVIKNKDGTERIHRQSLVNIVMTLIASILGGPVYFITRRSYRFLFFISFGVFNSALSQSMSSLIVDRGFLILGQRLMFDFWYNASIKFVLFEFVRPFLLEHRYSPVKVVGFRVGQDFFTTSIRVIILKLLRLGG